MTKIREFSYVRLKVRIRRNEKMTAQSREEMVFDATASQWGLKQQLTSIE